ncbi:MAG: hypothetical protein GY798_11705, partial [Hyphomicrobiales bacterium]|nr:hypothetical protein [Hyphomicrobiales bacterium]
KLFIFHPIPFLCGLAILGGFSAPWALPVAFVLFGITGGTGKTTLTAMWAEVFGVEMLGTVRSAVSMYMVLMSALSPWVLGVALAAGWSIGFLAALGIVIAILLMTPSLFAERYLPRR